MDSRRLEALRKAGLIPERQGRLMEAQAMLDAEVEVGRQQRAERERQKRFDILKKSTDPASFRREARKLLLNDANLVVEILAICRSRGLQNKKEKGGGRLNAQLIQVREALRPNMSVERKREIVDELFPNK